MLDFTVTEEQAAMREMAHDFAEKEIRSVAWDYDRGERSSAVVQHADRPTLVIHRTQRDHKD